MQSFAKFAGRLRQDLQAVTALEYALIAAVMGALIVTAVSTLGGDLGTTFSGIGTFLTTTASGM
jgi:pilus assembly protein Flp/PilA